jgi:acyl carrier protein
MTEGRDMIAEITDIFRVVFGDDTIQLNRSTTAADIEQWDSLTHIEMIVAVEKQFGIRFTSRDLEKLENVGDLAGLIKSKLIA